MVPMSMSHCLQIRNLTQNYSRVNPSNALEKVISEGQSAQVHVLIKLLKGRVKPWLAKPSLTDLSLTVSWGDTVKGILKNFNISPGTMRWLNTNSPFSCLLFFCPFVMHTSCFPHWGPSFSHPSPKLEAIFYIKHLLFSFGLECPCSLCALTFRAEEMQGHFL